MKIIGYLSLLNILLTAINAVFNPASAQSATFQINATTARKSISLYIYGMNYTSSTPVIGTPENYTSFRLGGNRLTGYNWENNASNAGVDYINDNDSYLCSTLGLTGTNCNIPGQVFIKFKQLAGSNYALATLPLAGYVAADVNGPVSSSQTAPSSRWKTIQHAKGSAFSLTPTLTDGFVYSDEFMNYLVNKLGTAANGGIQGYNLDNEPGLWSSNHPYLHPAAVGAAELATKGIALAKAIKSVDPSAETFGGVFYGFDDLYSLQSASDWPSVKGSYSWYVDYYLDQMKKASTTAGKRLLDVLDFHWYPEATGDNRIVYSNATTNADNWERMQAPRTLWDPTYQENSYISQWFSAYLPLITRLQTSINTYYPGTKLSISEYDYGPGNIISTGIAHADVLGILGKYGVYNANLWFLDESISQNYALAAFRIYTNYDGSNHSFGNTSVSATTSDIVNTSVYASIDGTDDRVLHIIAINKNSIPVTGTFKLTSGSTYTNAAVWNFHDGASTITKITDVPLTGSSFNYTLQPLSVNHIVLTNFSALPVRFTSFTVNEQNKTPYLQWTATDETAIVSYVIERSCNGHDFTSIAELTPANTGSAGRYSFTDLHYMDCGSSAERIWYRVKSLENNGQSSYTPARTYIQDHSGELKIFPNPASDHIKLIGLPSVPCQIELMNSDGSLIKKFNSAGTNQYSLDISSLAKNIYIIKVKTPTKTSYLKFVKH